MTVAAVFGEILNIFIRSVGSLLALLLIAKLTGPRQIAQLTFYDYIIGISIGSIAATMALDIGIPFYHGLFAMLVYFALAYIMSVAASKSIIARRVFTGVPSILIYQGRIIEENLHKQKFDLNDLMCACRSHGFFNLDDLEYVIMETNGALSFLPKNGKAMLTPADMGIVPKPQGLMANVIMDGVVMSHHLKSKGKNENWLKGQLRTMGYGDTSEIFLATLDDDGKIFVYLKNQKLSDGDLFE